MRTRDLTDLLLLAALWGASFLFMRMGAAEFGPFALAGLRVLGASAFLLPLLLWRGEGRLLLAHWKPLLVVGITNSALPFLCFSYAALAITSGLSSIFNATAPLWGALIAWWWLNDRPDRGRLLGLVIGFGGVLWLAWNKASFKADGVGVSSGLAVLACIVATLCYGFAANYTKRTLAGVPSLVLATGSQLAAAVLLAVPMCMHWPATLPGARAWGAVAALALLCTGVAYILFFRLIANIGASNAITVTFLIPAFAVLWGALFLGEQITSTMVVACGVILVGTALVTRVVRLPGARPG